MIKILYIIDADSKGGKERRFSELITKLSDNPEYDISIFFISKNFYYSSINKLNIEKIFCPRKYKYDFSVIYNLYKYLIKKKPDIIHSWGIIGSIFSIIPAKFLDIKLVDSHIADTNPKFKNILSFNLINTKIVNLFFDSIITNTYLGAKLYNVPKFKTSTIYNGINQSRFKKLTKKTIIKKTLEIKTRYVITMIARFVDEKDYLTYFKCAKQIISHRKDVTFLAVGDGYNFNSYIMNSIIDISSNRIKLLGQREDVEDIINISDIGVLSSFSEGLPNVLLEFMALGKPIIATNIGGIKEVFNDSYCYKIEVNDYMNMSKKIKFLLENKEKLNEMSANAKKTFINKFTIETMVDSYNKVYLSLYNK